MRILITGAKGFIGTNLRHRLREAGPFQVAEATRDTPPEALADLVADTDYVFHLAGVNRPPAEADFQEGNVRYTETLCDLLAATGRRIPLVLASSTQAALDNPYGRSKAAAERVVQAYGQAAKAPVHLVRLTNVFGKWSRPHYNSAVASFCHDLARNLPIALHDPAAPLNLLYIDDVMEAFLGLARDPGRPGGRLDLGPVYATTVGEVAGILQAFKASRAALAAPRAGGGLVRALYATYLSFLPPDAYTYGVKTHRDPRGEFAELVRTPDCGQMSYFTAHPGVTRGEHYHHTKAEKFLVIRGEARFRFRHVETGATLAFTARGGEGRVVETIPGWAHDITNVSDVELVVMLWANETFDPARPDTYPMKVVP